MINTWQFMSMTAKKLIHLQSIFKSQKPQAKKSSTNTTADFSHACFGHEEDVSTSFLSFHVNKHPTQT